MIKMIICTSSEEDGYAIGCDNQLLVSVPSDLKYFKSKTEGGCVLMGNNTFQSLPFKKGLPNRKNLVLSRTLRKSFMSQDIVYFTDVQYIKNLVGTIMLPFKDIWVIGGAKVYEQMLPDVQEIHHTTISGSYPEADTHFSMDFLKEGWKLVSVEKLCDKATVKVWRRL